jgi:hypothetical protein
LFARAASIFFHQRAGEDAHHLTRHEPFHRLAHLLADGHMHAAANEAGDVALGGVGRDAGHGHARALGHIARGEHDIQLACGDMSILVERLVEIAQPEKRIVSGYSLDLGIVFGSGNVVLMPPVSRA